MNSGELIPIKKLFDFEKGQLQSSKNTEGQYTFITAAQEWKTHESFTHDCEALIFAAAASGSLGRTHYYNGKFIASDLCFVLTPKEKYKNLIDTKFYHTIFNSLRDNIVKQTSTGTSKVSINKTNFGNYEIPLFDIDHQNSIKEKLEFVQPKKSTIDEELQTQLELINKLRSSILSDAVSGKLVPQDPNDESAEVLLEKIQAEKEKLIKEGKIKKQKPLSPISEDEIPYKLPDGWVWCRFGDICKYITSGSTPSKVHFTDNEEIPYLKVYNIVNQKINFEYKPQFIKQDIHNTKLKRSILETDDLIMNIVGPPLGKTALIPDKYNEWNCNQAIAVFKTVDKTLNVYLHLYLSEGSFLNQINLIGTAGQDNISITKSNNILVPLPPLEEQKRIVEKVEKLMATCDALELEVQNSKTKTKKLMQSVLKEAFEN
jgi:type I restriction enzyme S subunit